MQKMGCATEMGTIVSAASAKSAPRHSSRKPLRHVGHDRYCHMTAGRRESSGSVLTPTFCRPLPMEDICAMKANAEPYARCQSGHVSWLNSTASRVPLANPTPQAAVVSVTILSTMLGGALTNSGTTQLQMRRLAQPGERTRRWSPPAASERRRGARGRCSSLTHESRGWGSIKKDGPSRLCAPSALPRRPIPPAGAGRYARHSSNSGLLV